MKHKVNFSSVVAEAKPEKVKVEKFAAEGSEGVRIPLMLFSTRWNRNHAYFQVADLLRWQNKAGKVLFNFNHDLSESEGKYLGVS